MNDTSDFMHGYLWNSETGDGKTSDEIGSEHPGRVRCDPAKDGEDELQPQPTLGPLALALKLLQRRVVEESLP